VGVFSSSSNIADSDKAENDEEDTKNGRGRKAKF
jgi:hypothetical protein